MRFFCLIGFIFIGLYISAQVGPNLYYLEFTDKQGTPYSIENPEEFLTNRAIQRRELHNIPIDSLDLPVNPEYIQGVQNIGLEIVNVTKWLNGVIVRTDNFDLVAEARNLSYVKDVARYGIDNVNTNINTDSNIETKKQNLNSYYNYGLSEQQIKLHNGDHLHNQGFHGEGILIAVIDGGFLGAEEMTTLEYLRNSGRIKGTRDFSYGDGNVFGHHYHGAAVLSIMAGYIPNEYIGTAPEADYLLITSENVDYEMFVEELNWASAIEYADSMGVDIANVSLGYREYDYTEYNYEYADMNGHTSAMANTANIAANKGILIVAAAGNNGDEEVKWIGTPADADSVITIGAIDINENYASLGSIGYSSDGRIKPDFSSVASDTYLQYNIDVVEQGSGTSFATPIMTGLIACLWQKFSQKSNMEIYNALVNSARATLPSNPEDITLTTGTPNVYTGRGIADFLRACEYFESKILCDDTNKIEIFPNPTQDFVNVITENNEKKTVNIYNSNGSIVICKNMTSKLCIDLQNFATGSYLINILRNNELIKSATIIKE